MRTGLCVVFKSLSVDDRAFANALRTFCQTVAQLPAHILYRFQHCAFFQNSECEYFPCHKTEDSERFNCLFCYCPLYALEKRCGGNFPYTASGYKDCTNCMFLHHPENYARVFVRYEDILQLVKENDGAVSK